MTILLLKDVFENVSSSSPSPAAAGLSSSSTLASVKLSFVEIYNDTLTDLLLVDTDDAEGAAPGRKMSSRSSPRWSLSGGDGSKGSNNHVRAPPKLTIVNERRGQVRVQGLTTVQCSSIDDALELLARGERQRRVAATKMNKTSSRSHSVLRIELERTVIGGERQTTSILNVVDLAGSERVGGATGMSPAPRSAKSLASSNSRTSDAGGERWKEGINIVRRLLLKLIAFITCPLPRFPPAPLTHAHHILVFAPLSPSSFAPQTELKPHSLGARDHGAGEGGQGGGARPVPRQHADAAPAELPGGEHEDRHGVLCIAVHEQRGGNGLNAPVRPSRKTNRERSSSQRLQGRGRVGAADAS